MVMSIGDIFAIADSASSSIRVFRTGVSAAEEALSAARSQRLPDISVSASVSYLGNGVLWDRNFGNSQKIDIPHFGNNLAIEAQQVIYAGGAVSSGIETARLEHQKAGLDLEQHRQDVRFMLVGYYLELYRQYNLLEVLRCNIALNGQVLEDMRARYSQGTVLRNDITRYELQQVRMERASRLPQIAVVAADHLDGPITIEVPVLNNNFILVRRSRYQVRHIFSLQGQRQSEAGQTQRPQGPGKLCTGTGGTVSRGAGGLCGFPHFVHGPAHSGEGRGAG